MTGNVDQIARFAYALICMPYLFTVGLLSARHRALIGRIARHFGYERQGQRALLPTVTPSQFIGSGTGVFLRAADAVEGNITVAELVVISQLVKAIRPARIFEIGTFDGRTTLAMADNAEQAEVLTLDLPPSSIDATALRIEPHERHLIQKEYSGSRFTSVKGLDGRIRQLWGDSGAFDFSPYVGSCDFVFVDGSHAYDYVRNDTERALELVGVRGMVVWHDYDEWPGVTRALNEYHRDDVRFRSLVRIRGTTLAVLIVGDILVPPEAVA